MNMSDYRKSGIELEMFRINPFRLFYPGQTYSPDDLNPIMRPWELARTASKPKKVRGKPCDSRGLSLIDSEHICSNEARLSPSEHHLVTKPPGCY